MNEKELELEILKAKIKLAEEERKLLEEKRRPKTKEEIAEEARQRIRDSVLGEYERNMTDPDRFNKLFPWRKK